MDKFQEIIPPNASKVLPNDNPPFSLQGKIYMNKKKERGNNNTPKKKKNLI